MSEQDISEQFEFAPGALLKQARERKDLAVKEVADKLKLTEQAVLNIEADNYKDIPITFYRGYVKNYANLLELDEQSFAENFSRYAQKNQLGSATVSYQPMTSNKSNRGLKLFVRLVSVLIVLALLYSVYYLMVDKGLWNKFIASFDKEPVQQEQLLTPDQDDTEQNEGELLPQEDD